MPVAGDQSNAVPRRPMALMDSGVCVSILDRATLNVQGTAS